MKRRDVLRTVAGGALSRLIVPEVSNATPPPVPWPQEDGDLKITSVRLVEVRPKRPIPDYTPDPKSWIVRVRAGKEEIASPVSVYPKYKPSRSLFGPDDARLKRVYVEIGTNQGVTGLAPTGPGGGPIIEGHLVKLLLGENPLNVERLWDIMWRATMSYGRKGAVLHGISGVDLALWDLAGKVWHLPVYRLLGGETKARIPAYCTGNDIEQHVEFGYTKLKLALPYGPVDGAEGIRRNVALVKRAREAVGRKGEVMVDCWMSLTERYTLELAEAIEPFRVYWLEECLPPDDYEGMGRLRKLIRSTRLVTGEHEYTRYGFRQLLEHDAAEIWQPDVHWCGGLTELRRIGALAAAYDIPIIPHGGGQRDAVHYVMATSNAPWAELSNGGMPAPGGPPVVYQRYEEDNLLSRGPEGIYTRPSEEPGFGWDLEVVS